MTLFIAGQDIDVLNLGFIDGGVLKKETTVATNPEGYLEAIVETLSFWETNLDEVDKIALVTGPGSFTASRISATIANAFVFARHLPIYTIENPDRLPMSELVSKLKDAKPLRDKEFASPTYDRPPNIT